MRERRRLAWPLAALSAVGLTGLLLLLPDADPGVRRTSSSRPLPPSGAAAVAAPPAEPGAAADTTLSTSPRNGPGVPTDLAPDVAGEAPPVGRRHSAATADLRVPAQQSEDVDGGLWERLAAHDRRTRGLPPGEPTPFPGLSTFVLSGTGELAGRVVDQEGIPVPHATVLFEFLFRGTEGHVLEGLAFHAGTDGDFLMTGLPAGTSEMSSTKTTPARSNASTTAWL